MIWLAQHFWPRHCSGDTPSRPVVDGFDRDWLSASVVVFWLLQFSRALRVMRLAAQAPVGMAPSAVMLHSKLATGMRLMDVVTIARSLGRKVRDEPETFAWRDESQAEVEVEFVGGRCRHWRLERPK